MIDNNSQYQGWLSVKNDVGTDVKVCVDHSFDYKKLIRAIQGKVDAGAKQMDMLNQRIMLLRDVRP